MRRFAFITMFLFAAVQESRADSIEEDLRSICGWYHSLTEDQSKRRLSAEQKFNLAFDEKTRPVIKYTSLRMFYSALRTTAAEQRYDLMRAYAEGVIGRPWECPPMKAILQEFVSLDRLFQYSRP